MSKAKTSLSFLSDLVARIGSPSTRWRRSLHRSTHIYPRALTTSASTSRASAPLLSALGHPLHLRWRRRQDRQCCHICQTHRHLSPRCRPHHHFCRWCLRLCRFRCRRVHSRRRRPSTRSPLPRHPGLPHLSRRHLCHLRCLDRHHPRQLQAHPRLDHHRHSYLSPPHRIPSRPSCLPRSPPRCLRRPPPRPSVFPRPSQKSSTAAGNASRAR